MAGVNNSLATKREETKSFSKLVSGSAYQTAIRQTLTDPERAARFTATIISTVTNNPKLEACTPRSIIGCALVGEGLGLPVSPQLGCFYLIPRDMWNSDIRQKEPTCTFQIGVAGFRQLAMRSGQIVELDVFEIREGEYKGRNAQTGQPEIVFEQDDDKYVKLKTVGYAAYFKLQNGFTKRVYWSRQRVIDHATKYAYFDLVAFDKIVSGEMPKEDLRKYSSPWYGPETFHAMAKKTVLKDLLKNWAPLSASDPLTRGLDSDESVGKVTDDGVVTFESAIEGEFVQTTIIDAPQEEEAPPAPPAPAARRQRQGASASSTGNPFDVGGEKS